MSVAAVRERPQPTVVRRPVGRGRAVGVAVVLVPAVVTGGLSAWGIRRGMWWDETVTYDVATRGVSGIWGVVQHVDVVHALYYLLMHLLLPPGAGDAVLLRLPSVLGMALAAGATAAVGRRLAGPAVGVVAGLLLAVTPLASHYAQEGRSYALVTGLTTLTCLLLLRAVERPTATPRWAAYGAAVLLASLLHLFAALILAAHGAALVAGRAPRRARRRWLVTALAVVVCLAPFAWYAHTQMAQISLLTPPDARDVAALVRAFAGPRFRVVAVVGVLAAAGALPLATRRPAAGRLRLPALAVPWLVLPPGLLLAGSLIRPAYHQRYVLYSLPALALLTAAGVAAAARLVGRRRTGVVTGALGLALAAGLFVTQLPAQEWQRSPQSRSDDQTAVAVVVGRHARPGDAVVFVPAAKRNVAYVYAADFAGTVDPLLRRSPVASRTLGGEEAPAGEVTRLLLPHRRVWLVDRTVIPLRDAMTAAKREVLRDAYRAVTSFSARGETITLYVRRS